VQDCVTWLVTRHDGIPGLDVRLQPDRASWGIEFLNGVIVDSDLGVECELVRRAFWTNPQQVGHP